MNIRMNNVDRLSHGLTAAYHTLGCKLNFAETSTIAQMLAERGVRRAAEGEDPDIVVVNTCSVTELADKKSKQTIRSIAKHHPEATIVATGCYSQLKSGEAIQLPGVAIVAGNDQKDRIVEFLDQWFESKRAAADGQYGKHVHVVATKDMRRFVPSCSRGDRTRYFLKVQDGCDYYCTYCTIPMARGRSRSGTIGQMVELTRQAGIDGGREIVITGVNIGDFGKGRDDKFIDLIKALDGVDTIDRYRISSIEPNLLTDDVIDFVAQSRAFMPHLHKPLQSGSDTVLGLMRRHYDTRLFRGKIQRIREAMPDAFIGVDLIVGARGETIDEYRRSYDFVDSLDISRLHVFPYSERPGTKALSIDTVVPQEEKHRRAKEMIELSDKKLLEFTRRFEGSTRPVLIEHSLNGKPMSGFTDNYLKVHIDACTPDLDNKIVDVLLGTAHGDGEMDGRLAL